MNNEKKQSDAYCPSCERFIGNRSVCPYCETDSAAWGVRPFVRATALLLAFLSVAALHFAVLHDTPPLVKTSAITKKMNYGWVKISGYVTRKPTVIAEDGKTEYLSFVANDDSGKIRIVASGETADRLQKMFVESSAKTNVSAIGTVEFDSFGKPRIRIHLPKHVELTE